MFVLNESYDEFSTSTYGLSPLVKSPTSKSKSSTKKSNNTKKIYLHLQTLYIS